MNLDKATQIINYEIAANVGEQLEAYKVFFKETFNVDVQNEDGTFKTISQVFEEGAKMKNIEKVLNELSNLVRENYKAYNYNWTSERSCGNYDDCFEDGFASGQSNLAYEVGCILGMVLETPVETEEDDEEDDF